MNGWYKQSKYWWFKIVLLTLMFYPATCQSLMLVDTSGYPTGDFPAKHGTDSRRVAGQWTGPYGKKWKKDEKATYRWPKDPRFGQSTGCIFFKYLEIAEQWWKVGDKWNFELPAGKSMAILIILNLSDLPPFLVVFLIGSNTPFFLVPLLVTIHGVQKQEDHVEAGEQRSRQVNVLLGVSPAKPCHLKSRGNTGYFLTMPWERQASQKKKEITLHIQSHAHIVYI